MTNREYLADNGLHTYATNKWLDRVITYKSKKECDNLLQRFKDIANDPDDDNDI